MEIFTNCVAIFFILHFCWSYYWNCYRKGYILDPWHFNLLILVMIIHVMLPFNRSDLNIFALGGHLRPMQAHMTQAYLISAFGYAGILVGSSLWRVDLGTGIRRIASRTIELPAQGALVLLQSKPLLLIHAVLAFLLSIGVILYYFRSEGFGLAVGSLAMTNPGFRPFVQFAAFYSILIGSYCCARFYARREPSMVVAFLLLNFTQLFFGARSNIVAMSVMTVTVALLRLGRRANLFVVGLGFVIVAAFIILLDSLRRPNFSLQHALADFALSTFYGNTFSDTRDFALILSEWDGRYFHGLTFLAAAFAFVPRYFSNFRDTWSVGVVTAKLTQFDTTQHAGFRLGPFGEVYLNFGLPGVVLLSLLVGAVMRLVDMRMKQSVKLLPRTSMVPFCYYFLPVFPGVLENSTGAASMYTVLFIFALTWVMLQIAYTLRLGVGLGASAPSGPHTSVDQRSG